METVEAEFTEAEKDLLAGWGYEVTACEAHRVHDNVGVHDVRLEGRLRKYDEDGQIEYVLTITFSHGIEPVENTFRKEDELYEREAVHWLDSDIASYLMEYEKHPGILSPSTEK